MTYDLIIIGAGPTGIEAALQAKKRGFSYLLLEKDDAGALIEQTMHEKKFYQIYGRNTATIKGDLAFPDRLKGYELVALWKKQTEALSVVRGVTLRSLVKAADEFVLTTTVEEYRARTILLTSGTFEGERKLEVPGEQGNPKILYRFDYYNSYEGKKILVVGGGNSALETAIECADANTVTMLIRRDDFSSNAAENNRETIREYMAGKKVTVLFGAVVERIDPDMLTANVNGIPQELPYDLLFVHVGFHKPIQFLENLGITCQDGKPVFNEKFETNIPGLYIAGSLTGADSIVECANQAYDIVQALKK